MKKFHVIHIKKYHWATALMLCGVLCLGTVANQSKDYIAASATNRQLPIYSVDCSEKRLSISFDAAWGNEDTQELIDILAEYQVSATFFVVGDWVERFPESVLALHEAGHEVMNHSDDHAHYPKLSPSEILADMNACNDKIAEITGVRPHLIRLPYGDYDDQVIATIRSGGMEPVQWDVDSLDWKDLSASDIADRVLTQAQEGSIVLFHNAALNTPEALPTIIATLQEEGYEFVPISDLLLDCDYYLDHTGKQCILE